MIENRLEEGKNEHIQGNVGLKVQITGGPNVFEKNLIHVYECSSVCVLVCSVSGKTERELEKGIPHFSPSS